METDLGMYCLPMPHKMDAKLICEPRHEISNNVVCVTSKASDQPAHTHNLIRAFATSLSVKLLT